jgi:CheY-like chemotaxis protein
MVLLVEDELLVRLSAAEALRKAGFRVVEAVNGEEAMALLASGLAPQIVFTDVRMPGAIDGLTLLSFIRENAAQSLVFVTSGQFNTGDDEIRAERFIPKPYNPALIVDLFKVAIAENERNT